MGSSFSNYFSSSTTESNSTSTNAATSSNFIQIGIISFVVIIILVFCGLEFSSSLSSYAEIIIFWLLYVITIFTIVNIGLSIYFYIVLRNKKGPSGERGETGEAGDAGDAGICAPDCRDKICIDQVMKGMVDSVNDTAGNPDPPIAINNLYLKERVKQMCSSPEFKQLAPYRGPNDLITYLKSTWGEWVSLIYKAGGRQYFESIGAENEWKWVKDNPFNEIKKYDIFYWGNGRAFRPEIVKQKCGSKQGNSAPPGVQKGVPDIRTPETNDGRGWIGVPRGNRKYSIQTYLNLIPEAYITHTETDLLMYLKTVSNEAPNTYTLRRYDPSTKKFDLCISFNNSNGAFTDIQCNSVDTNQNWQIIPTGDAPGEIQLALSSDITRVLVIKKNNLDPNSNSMLFSAASVSINDADYPYSIFTVSNS